MNKVKKQRKESGEKQGGKAASEKETVVVIKETVDDRTMGIERKLIEKIVLKKMIKRKCDICKAFAFT